MYCPVCFKPFLQQIYQCVNGHSVCSNCKPNILRCPVCFARLTGTRNFTLEAVIAEKYFACKNAEVGCGLHLKLKNLRDHEEECDFRKMICCHCEERVSKSKIRNHINRAHCTAESYRDCVMCLHIPENVFGYVTILGELFYCREILKNKIIYWIVSYIGPAENASKFSYYVEMTKYGANERTWRCSEKCAIEQTTDDEIIESGLCASMPYSKYLTFTDFICILKIYTNF